jgi:hypothetical protein
MRKRIQLSLSGTLCCIAALAVGTTTSGAPQIPDVIVYDVGVDGGNTNDFHYYGQASGVAAYSIASQSCNAGNTPISWRDGGGQTTHPVIGQNIFRLKDGRFEQLGYSWLKHGFCAVDETEALCQCQPDGNCDWLGIGCADTYWATLNDGGGGRSKRWINATAGTHTENGPGPTGNATVRGRIQIPVTEIDPVQNPGAEYFAEIQYVTADDHAAGLSENNASYRRLNVLAVNNIDGGGPTTRELPAIYAWQDIDPAVTIVSVQNVETSGKSNYFLGYKVTNTAPGVWHYEYALQNFTSDQCVWSFSVPIAALVNVSNEGFHDVNAHSGDPWDTTDWPSAQAGGALTWSTADWATNQNANAIRWGTLYNFRFDANTAPTSGTITLGLFKPGPSTELDIENVLVPSPGAPLAKKVRGETPASGGDTMIPMTAGRNGTLVNPQAFLEITRPVVGQGWRTRVSLEGASRSVVLIGLGGPAEGALTKMGEVLIRPPVLSSRGALQHEVAIPDDPSLVGLQFSAQAAVLVDGAWKLTNALDVTVGTASN